MFNFGHDFKINDVVYLKHTCGFAIIHDKEDVMLCNATSHAGIRKATKSEARKYRKGRYNGRKAW